MAQGSGPRRIKLIRLKTGLLCVITSAAVPYIVLMTMIRRIVIILFAALLLSAPFFASGCVVHDDGWHHDHWHH
jgi:threonine/homoserine efflux transporter RhtA